jgi:splicing suppressor protein 51
MEPPTKLTPTKLKPAPKRKCDGCFMIIEAKPMACARCKMARYTLDPRVTPELDMFLLTPFHPKVLFEGMSEGSLEGRKPSLSSSLRAHEQPSRSQTHQAICNDNATHAMILQSSRHPLRHLPLPDRLTLFGLDQRLERWVKFHTPALMATTVRALALPEDIARAGTYVLRVFLAIRVDHGGSASKFFRVVEAEPCAVSEAVTFRYPWPQSLVHIARMRTDCERLGRGTVAAAALECPPLDVQMVPFGLLLDQLRGVQCVPHWKEELKRTVEMGKGFHWSASSVEPSLPSMS